MTHETEYTERRWAIQAKLEGGWTFLGKYCWPGASDNATRIPTFRKRSGARFAKNLLRYDAPLRVVKVKLKISIRQ